MKMVLMFAGVATVLLVVWLFPRKAQVVERPHVLSDPDGQILNQLMASGSDLTKLHDVEFFLNFPDEERALMACGELGKEGYAGKVDRSATGSDWLCQVTKRIVPSHGTIVAIRGRMNELAKAGGGQYDGWGATVLR